MNIIEIKDLNFKYTKKTHAVKDLSLEIKKGEYLCILGHNGSGKSTLSKLIVGLLAAQSGEIYIDGTLLTPDTVDQLRQKIGIVFQNPDNQFVGITVKDDIAFGLENRNIPREEMLTLIQKYASMVGIDKYLEQNPENLSGGEKQRVAIAGVLATAPEVIIFDESTSMLDPKGVREVNEVLKELKGTKTIIVITHNLNEALEADRIIVMKEGQIMMNDIPSVVFKEKELLKECHLAMLDSMKLIERIEGDNLLKNKEEIEDLLWEFTFKK